MEATVLALSITAGQLIKIPIGTHGGLTLLDLIIILFCLVGTFKLRINLKNLPIWIKTTLLFVGIGLISLIFSPLNLTPKEYFTAFSYILRFSLFFYFGFLIYLGFFPKIKKNIPYILTWSGISVAILGLLQFIFLPDLSFLSQGGWDPHYFRTVSTFFDPSFVGAYFTLTLILLTPKPLETFRKWRMLLFVLVYLALMTTFSRGAYLMFGVSFAVLSLLNQSIRLAILTIILSLGLFFGFNAYHKTVVEQRGIDRTQSAQYRVGSWERGWQIFNQSPILGVGFNAYRYALREYNLAPQSYLETHGASGNDSSLLHVLATTGIIGGVSYLLLLLSLVISKKMDFILISALLGLVAHSFFANSLFYPSLLIWIILRKNW